MHRREMLARSASVASLMAGLGALPGVARAAWNAPAFDAKSVADVVKALGASAPVESKEVVLTGPEIAENGAVVPLALSSTAPGVKRLMVLVEKNPSTLAAVFDVSESVEPNFSLRVKMAQTSNVYAVAITADNKVLFSQKEIKVTLGGCGG